MKDMRKDKIDQLKEFRVPLDKEALWAELESRQKKEKRRWFFWLFPALLFLGGALVWYANMDMDNLTISQESLKTTAPEKNATERSALENKTIETKQAITLAELPQAESNSSKSNLANQATTQPNSKTTATSINQSRAIKQNQQQPSSQAPEPSKSKRSTVTSSISKMSIPSAATPNLVANTLVPALPFNKTAALSNTEMEQVISRESITLSGLQGLTHFLSSDKNFEFRIPRFSAYNPEDVLDDEKEGMKSKSFLELYSGVGIVSRELRDEDHPTYAAIRSNTETPLESMRLGLSYGHFLGKNLFVSAGLEFGQITERFSYSGLGSETRSEMDSVVTDLFISAQGDTTVTSVGRGSGTLRTMMDYEIYNRLRTVGIPISLGWRTSKGKWSFGAEAGAMVNLSFGFRGTVLDSDLQTTSALAEHKNRIGVSWTGSFDLGYRLSENFSFVVRPSFKYVPNLIDSDISTMVQKYKVYNLSLGLRYQLN